MRHDGGWYYDPAMRAFAYIDPGDYEPGVSPEPTKWLDFREATQLIPVLEAEGYLKPRLDDRLRAEDLKIMHRLMDMLERNQPKESV